MTSDTTSTLDWVPPPPKRASGTAWLIAAIFASQFASGLAFLATDPTIRRTLIHGTPGALHINGGALATGLAVEWIVLLAASYGWARYDSGQAGWAVVTGTLGWRTCTRRALLVAAGVAAAVIAIGDGGDALLSAIGTGGHTTSATVIGGVAGSTGIGLVLLGALVAPLVEETFFRGALLPALTRRYRTRVAIGIDAAIFAVLHLGGAGVIDVFNLAIVAASGVALALLRLRTGSLWPGLAAHVAINLVGLVAVKA